MKRLLNNQILKLALVPILAAAFGAILVFGFYFASGDHKDLPAPTPIQQVEESQHLPAIPSLPETLRFDFLTKIFPSM